VTIPADAPAGSYSVYVSVRDSRDMPLVGSFTL
jgi:hypothetical protein